MRSVRRSRLRIFRTAIAPTSTRILPNCRQLGSAGFHDPIGIESVPEKVGMKPIERIQGVEGRRQEGRDTGRGNNAEGGDVKDMAKGWREEPRITIMGSKAGWFHGRQGKLLWESLRKGKTREFRNERRGTD